MTSSRSHCHLAPSTKRAQAEYGMPDAGDPRAVFDVLASRVQAALEAACGAPDDLFGARIRTALEDAAPLVDWLPSEVLRGHSERYSRHLLASDAAGRFAAAALIWRPGQMTPVHGHHTWCGYRVVKGVLSEALFEWDEAGARAIRTASRERAAGAASFVGAGSRGIHRLANLGDEIAVSLHVYGVHADAIATRVNHCVETAEPRQAA